MKSVALREASGLIAVVGPTRNRSHAHPAGIVRRIFRWIGTALWVSRQRQAEREIALAMGISGDHITDELERRIEEHLMRSRNFRV